MHIAQVAHLCPEHCEEKYESKAINREMGTQVQGLWDVAVPSGLLEWQAALSPPHAATFARVYSDFTSESPEQQKSKRAWPVRVSIELLPLMTTIGPQTLHKGKHNTTSATFTQSHSSHGTNEGSSPGASHVLCGRLLRLYCCPLWIVSASFLSAILMTDLHEFSHCSYCLQCIKQFYRGLNTVPLQQTTCNNATN